MLKNKKIVLSSIAIVFALVVSAIFVNYTLANSDSRASLSDAGSGSDSDRITGLSNIDLAIINSNDADKIASGSGEDEFRIVQIVPNNYSNLVKADDALKKASDEAKRLQLEQSGKITTASTTEAATGDSTASTTAATTETTTVATDSDDGSETVDTNKASYLGSYVYSGEFFRKAVFNGYKTIDQNMAERAVSLTTRTASYFDNLDNNTEAQNLLDNADFVYIWANEYTDYQNGDISEELYNWLDAYATANSHPIAICKKALCVEKLENIVGNNDTYRMGALGYKIVTKKGVARFDNVLPTESDFFKTLYEEASDNKRDDVTSAEYSLYRFIYNAETSKKNGGNDYIKNKTYFKWYTEDNSITDFLDGKVGDHTDSSYRPVGQMSGNTKNRIDNQLDTSVSDSQKVLFDNARILVISENTDNSTSPIFTALKQDGINSSPVTIDNSADSYVYKNSTWQSVQKAKNSTLTGHMYVDGTNNTGKNVASGADIYLVNSADLKAGLGADGTTITNQSFAESAFMDVKTKSVSGVVDVTDEAAKLGINLENVRAYLVVKDNTPTKIIDRYENGNAKTDAGNLIYQVEVDKDGNTIKDKDGNPVYKYADYQASLAGSTGVDKYYTPLKEEKTITGYDDDDEPIYGKTVYKYSFDQLNPDYDYEVVLGYYDPENNEELDDEFDSYNVGIVDKTAEDSDGYSKEYDFSIGKAAVNATDSGEHVTGYNYRKDANANYDYKVVNTIKEYKDNFKWINSITYESGQKVTYVENADKYTLGVDLTDKNKVVNYVKAKRDAYYNSEIAWQNNKRKIDFSSFDFIFIDDGAYTDEVGKDVYEALDAAVNNGTYVIVSSNAGDPSRPDPGGSTPGGDGSVIQSPSAKAVADVINSGVYRDGADNKFKVLEIQPDYPIDLDVASANAEPTKKNDEGEIISDSSVYEKRSDGTPITGSYYTVPSDVVSGKSKEEIETGTEYYQFDLTKAKIAHAVDGLNYGDIEMTQVSTEQLIGMKQDILSTYDLVYIGGDYSALDRDLSKQYGGQNNLGNATAGYTYMSIPSFIMYYHTGILNMLGKAGTYKPDRSSISDGPMMATPYVGGKYYYDTYVPENGNDLTLKKYEQLVEYIAANRPVIVSDELTSVYEKMQGTNASGDKLSKTELMMGYWYNTDSNGNKVLERKNIYLDPSSRMYDLVDYVYKNKDKTSTSVLWGFDPHSTRYINDEDCVYGTSLFSGEFDSNGNMVNSALDVKAREENWYKNPTSGNKVYKFYKSVMDSNTEKSVDALIKGASQRVRLTVTKSPTNYKQGIESTYVKTNRLQFSFQVGNDNTIGDYTYRIYVDVDRNTKFANTDKDTELLASGPVTNGQLMNIPIALDERFYGSASWYIQILDSAGNTVAGKTGLCKVVNNETTTNKINVLQIQTMVDGQDAATWTATDSLYFDITSQTAHKIVKYNIYSNQTDYDNSSPGQYKALGRHENRFGIYEYDMASDRDDYYSNLADALGDDYDINLDMVVASQKYAGFTTADGVSDSYDCIDSMVSDAEKLEKGEEVDGHDKAWYTANAGTAYTAYKDAENAVKAPQKALNEYLQGAVDIINNKGDKDWKDIYTTKYGGRSNSASGASNWLTFFGGFNGNISDSDIVKLLNNVMSTGEYYMMLWPVNSNNTNIFDGDEIGLVYGREFKDLFIAYKNAKDAEIVAKDTYYKYLRYSYGKDFLKKMYSILIIGPSEGFGNFKTDLGRTTCKYILDYVNNGGDLFFFHDSMTPYANQGAVNLTKSLLNVVGMNRYHVDLTDQSKSYKSVTSKMTLNEAALVFKTADADNTDIYEKHEITANGQLEEGTLSSDGTVYEKYTLYNVGQNGKRGNAYTDSPNGLLKSGSLADDGTVYTRIVAKSDPKGKLVEGKLEDAGTLYTKLNVDSNIENLNGNLMKMTLTNDGTIYKQLNVNTNKNNDGSGMTEDTLMRGTLSSAGRIYEQQLDIPLYASVPENATAGYLINSSLKKSGKIYTMVSGNSNLKLTKDTLTKKTLTSNASYYVKRDSSTGLIKSDSVAKGKKYLEKTGLVYGKVKVGQTYYHDGWADKFNQVGAYVYTADGKYITAYSRVATQEDVDNNVQGYYFEQSNIRLIKTDGEEIKSLENANYAKVDPYIEKISDGTGKGYEEYTATEMSYFENGSIQTGYFTVESGKSGDTGYVKLGNVEKKYYLNSSGSFSEAWFTYKNGVAGDKGYVELESKPVKMRYLADGKTQTEEAWFTFRQGNAGDSGYISYPFVKKNYIIDDGTTQVGWFYPVDAKEGETGYVELLNVEKKTYVNSTGDDVSAWFQSSQASEGTKGYVVVPETVQKNYIDSANLVHSGWFTFKTATAGARGYVEVSGAEQKEYVTSEGKLEKAYFSQKTGKAGDMGYISVDNATKEKYVDSTGKVVEGWFTKTAGKKGDNGYIMTQPGQIEYSSSLMPNAMLIDSTAKSPYITNYAFNTTDGTGMRQSINANISDALNTSNLLEKGNLYGSDNIYVSALAMTALYSNGNMSGATNTSPYVYARSSAFTKAVEWSGAANGADYSETMKASQLNSGMVTLYPYNIGSSLNIAGTHQQAYALDLESENTTVWYTLSGSNNKESASLRSSKYAASPYDAMESYYIYTTSYGSGAVTYCGSGHSSVTGKGKRNNDERRLFINVIVNSATAVPDTPVITCYDPENTFASEDELDKDVDASATSGRKVYVDEVGTKTDYPEFDLEVTVPESTELSRVRVFYDLDYYTKKDDDSKEVDYTKTPEYNVGKTDADGNEITPEVADKLIAEYTGKDLTVTDGTFRKNLRKTIKDLQLQNPYFAEYGGFETFIVVEATYNDGEGEKSIYSIIRIKVSDPLFNLTENAIDTPAVQDFLPEKKICNA